MVCLFCLGSFGVEGFVASVVLMELAFLLQNGEILLNVSTAFLKSGRRRFYCDVAPPRFFVFTSGKKSCFAE